MQPQMSHEEHATAKAAARFGYGPLAHVTSQQDRLPAFGGEFQPGTYKQVADRKIANPAPLGLCAFALTTFVLGLINMGTRGVTVPNIVVGPAFGYGGLIQLLAGMWYVSHDLHGGSQRVYSSTKSANVNEILSVGKWPLATLSVPPHSHLTAVSGSHSPSFSHPEALQSNRLSRAVPVPQPSATRLGSS